MKTDVIELYIHIPFCAKKCGYCDFLSFCAGESDIDRYIDALATEIRSRGGMTHKSVDTIFVGGGTPTYINAWYIDKIFGAIYDCFDVSSNAEITIEGNPGTITPQKAEIYKKAGVNRFSLGLQSADNDELKKLGRIHGYEEFRKSYDILREKGFDNINVDIMSGLPGQSVSDYQRTLEKICGLLPEHISAYSLIIEENTPFYTLYNSENGTKKEELPDEDTERNQYYLTSELLETYGYSRYEISNYCREKYMCRHNAGYWRRIPYLGIGLGASSYYDGYRYRNTTDFQKYICCSEDVGKIAENKVKLTIKDKMEEFVFLGMRMTEGVKLSEFKEEFGADIYDVYGDIIKKYAEYGMLRVSGDCMFLTEKGTDLSNTVFADFIL